MILKIDKILASKLFKLVKDILIITIIIILYYYKSL